MTKMTDERQREIEKLGPQSTYDELAQAIVELFNERTRLTKEVANLKKGIGVTVCDCHTWPTIEEFHKYVVALESKLKKVQFAGCNFKNRNGDCDIKLDCDDCPFNYEEDAPKPSDECRKGGEHEWHNISSHGEGNLEQICMKCGLRRTHNPKEVRNCGNCGDKLCKAAKQPPNDHVCPVWCPKPDDPRNTIGEACKHEWGPADKDGRRHCGNCRATLIPPANEIKCTDAFCALCHPELQPDEKPKGVKYVTEPEDNPIKGGFWGPNGVGPAIQPSEPKKSGPMKLKCTICGLIIETLTNVVNIKVCEKCHGHWSYAPVEDEDPKPTIEDFQSPYEIGDDEDPYSIENIARMAMSCARCAGCQQYTCPVPNAVNQTNPRKKKG